MVVFGQKAELFLFFRWGAMAIRKIKRKFVSIYGNIFVFLSVLNDR